MIPSVCSVLLGLLHLLYIVHNISCVHKVCKREGGWAGDNNNNIDNDDEMIMMNPVIEGDDRFIVIIQEERIVMINI